MCDNIVLEDKKKTIQVESSQLKYTLNENLTHFTMYNIELTVCREWHHQELNNSKIGACSEQKALITVSTSKKGLVYY